MMDLDNLESVVGENVTQDVISLIVARGLSAGWENVSDALNLSEWQVLKLEKLGEANYGIQCLLKAWFIEQPKLTEGTYCKVIWDNYFCSPLTKLGHSLVRSCEDVFTDYQPNYAPYLEGQARRKCLENESWEHGDWTNYSNCADSYDDHVQKTEEEKELVHIVKIILFVGSILSIFFLTIAVAIFHYFRCLWCDRVTIHIHLMLALILRYILLFTITEPFVFNRTTNYRSIDILCKSVVTIYLYSTVSSINWMFIQGVYINGKLTTNVFNRKTPFKLYYVIGWVFPVILVFIYVVVMESNDPKMCWKGYSEMDELWIVMGPALVALFVNFLFLLNILRILLTKAHVNSNAGSSEGIQYWRAAKATVFLLPLLGVTNLLFVYNPGGNLHKYYVTLNSLFGSTQGIIVAVVYCYMSKDVRDAFCRAYRRFIARRNAYRTQSRSLPSQTQNPSNSRHVYSRFSFFRRYTANGNSVLENGNTTLRINENPLNSINRAETTQTAGNHGNILPKNQRQNLSGRNTQNSRRTTLSTSASENTSTRDMKLLNAPISPSSMRSSVTSLCSINLSNNSGSSGNDQISSFSRRSALVPRAQNGIGFGNVEADLRTDVYAETRQIFRDNQYSVVSIPMRDFSKIS